MREIQPQQIEYQEVTVPGSKSYTHRMLIAAGLADGRCFIHNSLASDDTGLTLNAVQRLGARVEKQARRLVIDGCNGRFQPCAAPIFLGNSGTSMRLLTAVVALGQGVYTLTGTPRMCQRPIRDLVDGMKQIGVAVRTLNNDGCPPVEIEGRRLQGGRIRLKCSVSSQYLSALLLMAPHTERGIEIEVIEGPVSKPYVDITVDVMEKFGLEVVREGYEVFRVAGGQAYRAGSYTVEPDCSQAGYFWAAAAISGAAIKVKGISAHSLQGDIGLLKMLEAMGCAVAREKDGITVAGGPLVALEADMADMPDMVPTLGVVAAFAKGTTVIKNVGHLQAKESDRLTALVNELTRMGIEARYVDQVLRIRGGRPTGAAIETYGDHRIAMSFAMAGLKIPGMVIKDEKCVEKSFPDFWQVFDGLQD